MLGAWQRFSEGPSPNEGEALVFIDQYDVSMIDAMLGDPGSDVVFAIYSGGQLHLKGGGRISPPYRAWWTSLPPHPLRGPGG